MPKKQRHSRKSGEFHCLGAGRRNRSGHPDREAYLLDPESLSVRFTRGPLARGVGRFFRDVFAPGPLDALFLGVDRRRALDAEREFPRARLWVGDGPSGGERALIANVDLRHIASRYTGITIGSGDGEFTALALEARRLGLRVRVASWSSRLSAGLARVADEVVLLDNFLPGGPGAISERTRTLRGTDTDGTNFVEAA